MKLYRQKLYSDLERNVVKEFLGVLSGFIHKAKVLHWAASRKSIHEYLDDFWKEIYEFQDTVAEGYMGIMGQLDNDIVFKAAESDNPWDFIREVEEKTLDFYNLLPSDPRYKGLSGETESFIQEIEKYKYLFSLATDEKEFSEKSDTKEKIAVGAGTTGLIVGGEVIRRRGGKDLMKANELLKSAEGSRISAMIDSESAGKLKEMLKNARTTEEYNAMVDKINSKLVASKAQHVAADKEISEAAIKKALGKTKKTAGKGLIIAGATLPAAYIIHRRKQDKKEKK